MKKRLTLVLAALFSVQVYAADARIVHGTLWSTFLDTDSQSVPGSEVTYVQTFPLHLLGYYFMDARLLNMGKPAWMLRFNGYARGEILQQTFNPDLRNLYIENRNPVGGHWLFSAGRMRSPYLNPMYRLDGAQIGFKPKESSPLTFGILGGMRPFEEAGFLNFRYKPFLAGAFIDLRGARQDQIRLVYSAGFDENIASGSEMDHQIQLQAVKYYTIFKKDCFIRGGVLYQTPLNFFEYAYAENTIFTADSTSHSISFIQSEAVFLLGGAKKYEKFRFQEAVYRFHHSPARSLWKLAFNGGYSYALEQDGYVFQVRAQRNQTFMQRGSIWFEGAARDRGYFRQIYGKVGYGIYPLGFVNVDLAAGFENALYRSYLTNAILAEVNIETAIGSSLDFILNADFRILTENNTEIYLTAMLTHYMGWHLGPKVNDRIPAPEPEG